MVAYALMSASLVASVVPVATASAAEGEAPLRILRFETNAVHPTRVHLVVEVAVVKPDTHWRIEYVPCDEAATACEKKLEQSPLILASGELQNQADAPAESHHLTQNTTYYARAVVSSTIESASKAIILQDPRCISS